LDASKYIRENNETLIYFRDPDDIQSHPTLEGYLTALETTNIYGSQLTLMALYQARNITMCLMSYGYAVPVLIC
jgi:hypothetical protein